mmetsp:Transcript_2622/g.4503  ORF Transcript_2622/g.4503 Transcript_2622/m.4503 type:complete len:124 (+) Transcript_2622:1066-1437(+)
MRHNLKTANRPTLPESETSNGQPTICAAENMEMTQPSWAGVAPMEVRKSGSVESVMPTPIICTNTANPMGRSDLANGILPADLCRGGISGFICDARQQDRLCIPCDTHLRIPAERLLLEVHGT